MKEEKITAKIEEIISKDNSKYHEDNILFLEANHLFKGIKCNEFYEFTSDSNELNKIINKVRENKVISIGTGSYEYAPHTHTYNPDLEKCDITIAEKDKHFILYRTIAGTGKDLLHDRYSLEMIEGGKNGIYQVYFSDDHVDAKGEYTNYYENGRFRLKNQGNPCIYFMSNEAIQKVAEMEGLTFEELKYKIIHGGSIDRHIVRGPINFDYYDNMIKKLKFPDVSFCRQEINMIINKIYREGLEKLAELSRNEGTLEITDEDRKFFANPDLDGKIEETKQISIQDDKMEETKQIDSMNYQEKSSVEESSQVNSTNYQNMSSIDKDNVETNVEMLLSMKELGITLDDKQLAIIAYYQKMNSDKFRQYQADREKRKQGQMEAMEKITKENEHKEAWLNSEENPTNIREEKLSKIRKQIDLLNKIKETNMSLLSEEQKRILEKNGSFIEMLDNSKDKVNEDIEGLYLDTGMNPEIRNWYIDHYQENDDSKPKSR